MDIRVIQAQANYVGGIRQDSKIKVLTRFSFAFEATYYRIQEDSVYGPTLPFEDTHSGIGEGSVREPSFFFIQRNDLLYKLSLTLVLEKVQSEDLLSFSFSVMTLSSFS